MEPPSPSALPREVSLDCKRLPRWLGSGPTITARKVSHTLTLLYLFRISPENGFGVAEIIIWHLLSGLRVLVSVGGFL